MPEGDTVWRAARRLDDALAGQLLTVSDFRVPQHATLDLSEQLVHGCVSRGKHLLTRIGDHTLHTHLKMEGTWHVYRPADRWRRPAHQARVVLGVDGRQAVGFALGVVEVVPTAEEHRIIGHLGPDLLDPQADLAVAKERILTDPDRPVFLALLDQRNVAGLGNEYVNELLFTAGLHPLRPVGQVPDVARLLARGRQMLEINKDRTARSFTGSTRPGQERWVFSREHGRCRRCGTAIATGSLGDDPTRERNTFWCPHCQPAASDQ